MYKEILHKISSGQVEERLDALLGHREWENPQQIRQLVEELKAGITSAIEDISDDEDKEYYCAVYFVKTKAHWVLLNTQINYQTATTGQTDPWLMANAAIYSYFIELVEPSVDKSLVKKVQEIMNDPIGASAAA